MLIIRYTHYEWDMVHTRIDLLVNKWKVLTWGSSGLDIHPSALRPFFMVSMSSKLVVSSFIKYLMASTRLVQNLAISHWYIQKVGRTCISKYIQRRKFRSFAHFLLRLILRFIKVKIALQSRVSCNLFTSVATLFLSISYLTYFWSTLGFMFNPQKIKWKYPI